MGRGGDGVGLWDRLDGADELGLGAGELDGVVGVLEGLDAEVLGDGLGDELCLAG
jgi:hypothetical protein